MKSIVLGATADKGKTKSLSSDDKILTAFYSFQKTEDTRILDTLFRYIKINNINVKEDSIKSKLYYLRGVCCYMNKNFEKSGFFFNKALTLIQNSKDHFFLGLVNNAVGANEVLKNKNFLKARDYYKKALFHLEKTKQKQHIIDTYYNLFMNSRDLCQWESSIKYVMSCLDLMKEIKSERNIVRIYARTGDSYVKLGDYANAVSYFKKAEQFLDENNLFDNSLINYVYGEYYSARNKFKKASNYFKKSRNISVKMHFKQQALLSKSFAKELDLESKLKKDKEIIIKAQRRSMFLGSISLIFLVLLVSVLFFNSKRDRKKKREIIDLNKKLSSLIVEMKEKNILLKDKKSEIENLLKLNEQSLFSRVLKISTYNDNIRNISKDIDAYVDTNSSASKYLIGIKKKLNILISEEELWDDFKVQFEKNRPEFFEKLKNVAPDLSVNDLKHCTYIVSNLKSKEVAQMINVSPRSVETTRYRIKKKIGLDKEDSLYNLLNNL
ncbi:tetratricopeptide repeat protein [Tenacibaculum sp. C7A-26P2]|uniref:tetratricopeptide repeat protein n=1 Tax=Tenacibaculum sp. C7A-26P2 TaxID=3447504 RepID=UPI003F82A74A